MILYVQCADNSIKKTLKIEIRHLITDIVQHGNNFSFPWSNVTTGKVRLVWKYLFNGGQITFLYIVMVSAML